MQAQRIVPREADLLEVNEEEEEAEEREMEIEKEGMKEEEEYLEGGDSEAKFTESSRSS